MTPTAFDPADALLVSAVFVLGGLVKGVAGFGLPTLGLGLLVLWKHRDNLDRLLSGTEPRVGASRNG